MRVPPFELERWQSQWEHRVQVNVAESGVMPLTVEELVEDRRALAELLRAPLGYPQTNGSARLRSRIADLHPGAAEEHVLVTAGCSEANFLVAWSLIEPGDEVVVMLPNYLQLPGLARALGARVRPLWLKKELGWQPDPDELPRLIHARTKLVAVCHPNNPTGAVLDESTMEAICTAADRTGAWILADEVYRGAELGEAVTPSFWGRGERVLVSGGLSKAYGLPGLRVGWVVGPPRTVEALWGLHDYTTISPTVLGDGLASIALEPEVRQRLLARTRSILVGNYRHVQAWVADHAMDLEHLAPRAGAIAWLGYRRGRSSADVARWLLERRSVLVAPGVQFGVESHLRIGFGGEQAALQRALRCVAECLHEPASES